jgi:hypothetical protein
MTHHKVVLFRRASTFQGTRGVSPPPRYWSLKYQSVLPEQLLRRLLKADRVTPLFA